MTFYFCQKSIVETQLDCPKVFCNLHSIVTASFHWNKCQTRSLISDYPAELVITALDNLPNTLNTDQVM